MTIRQEFDAWQFGVDRDIIRTSALMALEAWKHQQLKIDAIQQQRDKLLAAMELAADCIINAHAPMSAEKILREAIAKVGAL